MNLSKVLKQKRDAENRLRQSSPQTAFNDNGSDQSFANTIDYATKVDLAGKADINHNHDSYYADIDHNHDDVYVRIGQVTAAKHYELLCNNGEILFSPDGDILMGEVI